MTTANAKLAIEKAATDAAAASAAGAAAQIAAAHTAINDELTNLTHFATRADADQVADVLLDAVVDKVTADEAIWALSHADVVTAVTAKLVAAAALAPIAPASRAEHVLVNSKDDTVLSAFAQAAAATPAGNIAKNAAFRAALINHMVAKANDPAKPISAGEAAFLAADASFAAEVVARLKTDPTAVNLANNVTVCGQLTVTMNAEATAGNLSPEILALLNAQPLPVVPNGILYQARSYAVGTPATSAGYVKVKKVRDAINQRMLQPGITITGPQENFLLAQKNAGDPEGFLKEAKDVAIANAQVAPYSYGLANGPGVRDLLAADMVAKASGAALSADETALLTIGAAHTPLLRDAVIKAAVEAVKADLATPKNELAVFDNATVQAAFIAEVARQAGVGAVNADYLAAIDNQAALRKAFVEYILANPATPETVALLNVPELRDAAAAVIAFAPIIAQAAAAADLTGAIVIPAGALDVGSPAINIGAGEIPALLAANASLRAAVVVNAKLLVATAAADRATFAKTEIANLLVNETSVQAELLGELFAKGDVALTKEEAELFEDNDFRDEAVALIEANAHHEAEAGGVVNNQRVGEELAARLVAAAGAALTAEAQALLAHPANKPCIEKHIAPAAVTAGAAANNLIKNQQVGEAIVAEMAKVKGPALSVEQTAVLAAMQGLGAGDADAVRVITNAKAAALAHSSVALSNDVTLQPLLLADMQVAILGAGVPLSVDQSNLLKANNALAAAVGAIALANPAEVALANDPSVQAWIIADMRSRVGGTFPTANDDAILAAAAGNTLAAAVAQECYAAKDTASTLATYNAGGTNIATLRGAAQAAHIAALQGEIAASGAQHQVSTNAAGDVTLSFKGTTVSAGTGTAAELEAAKRALARSKK